jgi:hypothetical protein
LPLILKGKSNVLADFLSRYPIEEDGKDDELYKPEANSIEDVDFFGYLANVEAEAYVADSQIEFGDLSKKRRRNYRVSHASAVAQGNVVRAMSASYGKSLYSTLRSSQTP